eukprot:TRINITY_DN38414_c0_g1_i1.p1 TRINITY_DN38414_c0_g1~~TRINITY_DN38414_c0_g1_i1.p1  ORF type:complete len:356 (-),score=51.67 TRINITY_DN38414_c0_g1_i1:152-1171(-)
MVTGKQLRVCHTIGASPGWFDVVPAVLIHVLVWGGGMTVGPLSVVIAPFLYFIIPFRYALAFSAVVGGLVLMPELPESPLINRLFLRTACLLKGGSTLWISDEVLPHINDFIMVCFSPHGIIPHGFTFNGAIRAKTRQPQLYLPKEAIIDHRVSGVQAPVLFKIPILRQVLNLFGCTVPATKAGMFALFRKKMTFGIVVGGSEEVAIQVSGRERLYLKHRAGFLKYALQFGCKVVVAYNFGESDLYANASCFRTINLWLVKKFGFVLPIFYGRWWFPILPRGDVPLNTVYGAVLELPRIDEPTPEQVAEWHQKYIDAVTAVFDTHKARFGYGSRKLEIM